jgi:hypothetical protein
MTWEFGGTTLSMVANSGKYAVEEIDTFYNMPKVRGDNPEVPLREGRIHVEKVYDQRILTLGMWVVGTSESDYEERIDTLKQLFGSRDRQLLKRTMGDGSVRQAYAEVVNTLGFKAVGPLGGRFTVDFLVAGAFLRSDTQTSSGEVSVSASPTDFTVNNGGTVKDKSAVITFHGPLENPKLENLTNGIWVGLNDTLGAADEVAVDVEEFTADPEADIGNVEHSGDTYFMVLEPGDNSMRLTTDTTGGWVKVAFYAPYL